MGTIPITKAKEDSHEHVLSSRFPLSCAPNMANSHSDENPEESDPHTYLSGVDHNLPEEVVQLLNKPLHGTFHRDTECTLEQRISAIGMA